jgi:lactate dehydrogenase-like 2-hydroxyacid dehydrogenase
VTLAVGLLGRFGAEVERRLALNELEVAVLDRSRPRRTFARIPASRLDQLLA